jgi:HPt (histidine-containing phosphotransfer) domain-containing protein
LFPTWSEAATHEPASTAIASANAGAADELLDVRVLRELEQIAGTAGGGFLQRIYRLYLDNAPRIRAELARAIEAGEIDAAARAAHALKSMSHNIGARRVAAAAEAIERQARESGSPSPEHVAGLTRLLDATMASVRTKFVTGAKAPAPEQRLRQA